MEYKELLEQYNKKLKKTINKFIIVATLILLLSTLGIVIFAYNGFYIIHPIIYIMGIVIGLGWLITALTAEKEFRRNYKDINNL